MTTLATSGGMLPLALGIEAGSSTQAPLGTVVIGGLVSSKILSLLVVLYLWTRDPRGTAFPRQAAKLMPPNQTAPVILRERRPCREKRPSSAADQNQRLNRK